MPSAPRTLHARTNWFHGAVSFDQNEQGLRPWRLEFDRIELFEKPLRDRAVMPAGIRLAFLTDTPTLAIQFRIDTPGEPANGPITFDILVDGKPFQRATLDNAATTLELTGLPRREKRVEIYLPVRLPLRIASAQIPAGASLEPFRDSRPRWVVHGSSITHCGGMPPSENWPALVARRHDLHLTNLGFGGQCHIDQSVAWMITRLKADFISLSLGINVYGNASLNARTFRAAALGFITTIRSKHRLTPLVLVSPIFSRDRETVPNPAGMTLVRMRADLADAVAQLRALGDQHLHYVDGLQIMGAEEDKYMPDHLHPDAAGQWPIADHYGKLVMKKFGLRATKKTEPMK